MKKVLVMLLVIGFCAVGNTQVTYVPWSLPLVTIEWDAPTVDTNGDPVTISFYRVFESPYPTLNWVELGTIEATEYLVTVKSGVFVYGVTAVDDQGLESEMHVSTESAYAGGWCLERVWPPAKPTMLRIKE